jgi:radical SAM superfamily enzyme YgiQ (UPF0313 family)
VKPILLVNANTVRPPVSPVGLEYVAESLKEHHLPLEVVDLAFEPDGEAALRQALARTEPLLVGIAVRNMDDSSWLSATSFLPGIRKLVQICQERTRAPVVLGGGGFSIAPGAVLRFTGADMGIAGDGEEALLGLALRLAGGEEPWKQRGLVYRWQGRVMANPRAPVSLDHLPPPRRRSVDNPRYLREGAMVGVETKRGCSMGCVYCVDPLVRGKRLRLRPPRNVAQEMVDLVDQGVTWFHLCDSEFNLSPRHAQGVCAALIRAGLAERVRWYTYCSPTPMDRELLSAMKRAGCAGIYFGVDSLSGPQLERLRRRHRLVDIAALTRCLREEDIPFIFDLMIGAPGETPATARETVENARRLCPPSGMAGVSLGVRVYPGTPLARSLSRAGLEGLRPPSLRCLHLPTFYLSPALGTEPQGFVRSLVGEALHFLFLGKPQEAGSYNYAGDDRLARAIRDGARGAYWHIHGKAAKGRSNYDEGFARECHWLN